jgi:hypothetical protein
MSDNANNTNPGTKDLSHYQISDLTLMEFRLLCDRTSDDVLRNMVKADLEFQIKHCAVNRMHETILQEMLCRSAVETRDDLIIHLRELLVLGG